jgi:CRISPR/Cas system CSM-associated protein Csm5 (group 7 of RAMP superfamily)
VVTGHSTKSIAVYATRLSQVRNDNNTKTDIPWHIHIGYGVGIQIMTTFIYCKECKKLYDKELGCSSCEAQMYIEELD